MDFRDIKSEYSSSNLFNGVRICENSFSQDAQYRPRKSPRKKLKAARTSASLVIDQLKSIFWCPGDFTSRVKTRRNWRPEFLMRYLCDNRRGCNEGCNAVLRHDKRNFVPEIPKIYSIGLHSGARGLSDNDDFSSSCGVIRNFRKRFSIVRSNFKPTIICKYWITQPVPTSSLSADVSLKARTDHQTVVIDCTESTEVKYDLAQESNQENKSHHSQLDEHIEKKENLSDILQDDRAADDYFFIPDDFKDPSVIKDHKCGSSCITRDAQIQTSNRKKSRRRKTKKRSTEKISHRKHCNNEARIVADFRTDSHSSSRRSHRDEPRLRVQVLENKSAEYINKFTAVNRQIEEITATLRETCCSGESSRDTLENYDEYFSSISDDAKANTVNWSDVESRSTTARRNTSKEENDLINVKKVIGKSKSDRCKNVQEILQVDNLNNETVSSPIASSRTLEKISNDVFGCDSVRTIKETVYSSNRISRNKTKAKNRFVKQMSLDLTKNEDELQEFSIENEFFDEVYLKNDFAISNNDERARDSAEGLADLEESRYCKKIVEEKIGEVAILKDIKKRIDRDFDDLPAERSENDTEDFLTISRKSSNLDRHIIDVSATMIEESTPLSASTNLRDPTETQIHDSMSIGAMSECSNKNSALSKYFSCTQIPISSMENEDEFAGEAVDRGTIDSHSNLHSNRHYYDSRSHLSLNNCSLSNLDSSLDRSSLEYIARCDPSAQCTSPNKLESLIKTVKETNDTFEISEDREGFAESEICERKRSPHGEGERRSKERRAEKRYTADSTLETSKSSRYVGSIDSGVFSSSLIDLPAESIFDAGKLRFKKKRRAGKPDGPSTADSDSSCTDDTLDRKVNDVVRDLTKNLILCERRARMKLRTRDARCPEHILSRVCKLSRNLYDTCCDFFNSPRRSSEDERIVSISTPSLLSLSDSEIEDCDSRRQRVFY